MVLVISIYTCYFLVIPDKKELNGKRFIVPHSSRGHSPWWWRKVRQQDRRQLVMLYHRQEAVS